MAKGNMLQGMARGKVGDVVFSRLDGEQISRVRNRHPKNPRSNGQLYQRAIMATVMQAYAAGKEIFDHSFQGKAVGAANQRNFLSINAKKLRETISAEIAAGTAVASQVGRVVGPGVKAPVAFPFIVSDGTLSSIVDGEFKLPTPLENEKVGAYCTRVGLTANDLFTVVGFDVNTDEEPLFVVNGLNDAYAKQYPCKFKAVRLAVKAGALSSNEVLVTLNHLFEVTKVIGTSEPDLSTCGVTDGLTFDNLDMTSAGNYSNGCIHSKKDEDYRSKCVLSLSTSVFGLATQYALAAWQQGTVLVGDSDLILEGGEGGNVL